MKATIFENDPLYRWFTYEHLPANMQTVSKVFFDAAASLCDNVIITSTERDMALRKLLEAKDCAVRAARIEVGGKMTYNNKTQ